MKRPVFYILLFYILGLLSAYTNIWVPVFLGALLIVFYIHIYRKISPVFLSVLLFSLLFGVFRMKQSHTTDPLLISLFEKEITVRGQVENIPDNDRYTKTFYLHSQTIFDADTKYTQSLKLLVKIPEDRYLNSLEEGDIISISGTLIPLGFQRNPGAFHEFSYQRSRKIQATLQAKDMQFLEHQISLSKLTEAARKKIRPLFDETLPPEEANIMKAVLLGDKDLLGEETKDIYRDAGIYHILVVSGAHLSIIALSFFRLLLLGKMKKNNASMVALFALITYTLLAGAGISLVRAAIMCGVYLCSYLFHRKPDSLVSISLAAFLLLLYEPMYIQDPGFLLSFSAVLGLNFLTPLIIDLFDYIYQKTKLSFLNPIKKWIPLFAASLAAFLATIPVSSFYFHEIPIYAPIANIFVSLTSSALLIIGILTGIITLFSSPLGILMASFLHLLLNFYQQMSLFLQQLPFSSIITGKPRLGSMLLFALCLTYVLTFYRKNKKRLYIPLGILFSMGLIVFEYYQQPDFLLTFLDVGQGDAVVLETAGKTYLIDGGGWPIASKNTGKLILLPYLKSQGKKSIDGVFFSHGDRDHAFGLLEILDEMPVKACYLPIVFAGSAAIEAEILSICNEKNIPIYYLAEGDSIKNATLEINSIFPKSDDKNEDNLSMVLDIVYGDQHILLTGDITKEMEATILQRGIVDRVDILKLAHHGSNTSTSELFLETTKPAVAIISAGKDNSYGHPAPEVLNRLEKLPISVYNTGSEGAIVFYGKDKRIYKKSWRKDISWQ